MVWPGQVEVVVESQTRIPGKGGIWAIFKRKGKGLLARGNTANNSTEASKPLAYYPFRGWEWQKELGSKVPLKLKC